MNKQSVEVVVVFIRATHTNTNPHCYLSRCTIGVPSSARPNTGQLDVLDVELETGNGVPLVVLRVLYVVFVDIQLVHKTCVCSTWCTTCCHIVATILKVPCFELALRVLRNSNPQRRTVCRYSNAKTNLQQRTDSVLDHIYRGSFGVVGRQKIIYFLHFLQETLFMGKLRNVKLKVNRLLFCLSILDEIIEAPVIFVVLCWETN